MFPLPSRLKTVLFLAVTRSYQRDILMYTDERVKVTQEVMSGMRSHCRRCEYAAASSRPLQLF